jgi:hypothetical protein
MPLSPPQSLYFGHKAVDVSIAAQSVIQVIQAVHLLNIVTGGFTGLINIDNVFSQGGDHRAVHGYCPFDQQPQAGYYSAGQGRYQASAA